MDEKSESTRSFAEPVLTQPLEQRSGRSRRQKHINMRSLRAALHRRPDVFRLIVSLRKLVEKKNSLLIKLKARLRKSKTKTTKDFQDSSCQTETIEPLENNSQVAETKTPVDAVSSGEPPPTTTDAQVGWATGAGDTQEKSLAEQVAEAAQSALAQTGMVYVESAGMYYDYKSGYYYNSELGLYYHSSTGCYYCYSEEKNEFTYHSHADTRGYTGVGGHAAAQTEAVAQVPLAPETEQLLRKKEKLRKRNKKENQEIEEQGPTEAKQHKANRVESRMKRDKKERKKGKHSPKIKNDKIGIDKYEKTGNRTVDLKSENERGNDKNNYEAISEKDNNIFLNENSSDNILLDDKHLKNNDEITINEAINKNKVIIEAVTIKEDEENSDGEIVDEKKATPADEIEDGECSDTASEAESDSEDSLCSDSTLSDVDESVARQHPPCMRVVVRETNLPKLRVGSLFLVTKDGGTLGREGDDHAVLIRDENISRIHLQFIYNEKKRCYDVIDLGSKNGTILNGTRLSESQQVSQPVEVVHGSTLQVGETKLLCHVHPGTDTCGHCEPGLLMAAEEEKRAAYTRSCSVKRQHALELARLKNLYAPQPLAIEDGTYNDRAHARRLQHGSTHDAEKTQQNDLDTSITTDNKGFQMLARMGWREGDGLGREQQGDTQPVPLVSNAGTAGLGAGGAGAPVVVSAMRLSARPRAAALRPSARLFRDPLEEDD